MKGFGASWVAPAEVLPSLRACRMEPWEYDWGQAPGQFLGWSRVTEGASAVMTAAVGITVSIAMPTAVVMTIAM